MQQSKKLKKMELVNVIKKEKLMHQTHRVMQETQRAREEPNLKKGIIP
jgi:hypothetical protein